MQLRFSSPLVLLLLTCAGIIPLAGANPAWTPDDRRVQRRVPPAAERPSPLVRLNWLQEGLTRVEDQELFLRWFQQGFEHLSEAQQKSLFNQTREKSDTQKPSDGLVAQPEAIEQPQQVEWLYWLEEGMTRVESQDLFLEWFQQGIKRLSKTQQNDLFSQAGKNYEVQPSSHDIMTQSEPPEPSDSPPVGDAMTQSESPKPSDSPPVEVVPSRAPQVDQIEAEQLLAELSKLERDDDPIRTWVQTDQNPSLSVPSTSVSPGNGLTSQPSECSEPLEKVKSQLAQGNYSKKEWLNDIFACTVCCAPLLQNVMDVHASHVAAQPHHVVLFNHGTYTLSESHQRHLDALMQHLNKDQDQVLLFGRASQNGDKAYNMALSGRRASEIKDYLVAQHALDHRHIQYRYFGYGPPQLTLKHIDHYGIKAVDIAAVDVDRDTALLDKINQSVVVVIYQSTRKNGESSLISKAEPQDQAPLEQRAAPAYETPLQLIPPDDTHPEADFQRVTALLREFFPDGGDFKLRVWTNKGEETLYEAGEQLLVHVEAETEAYLQVDYYQADGQVVHLLPNPLDNNRVTAKQTMTLGHDSSSFQFAVTAPFGSELLTVIAGQRPLISGADPPPAVEPAESYIQRLSNQFKAYKTQGKAAAAYVGIRTRESAP